ncbi:nascent polypeptide-associated complex protein [Candidatus Woesearchaeota archaeon]|nr:nascent polypeptide-associated complex protein [Candidatus Woesearchaeota archaeon]
MFPGLNPRELEKAMKKLGVKQEEIDATEVIIKTKDKNLVIHNPQVSRINMMGQETLQVTGEIEEQETEKFSEDDIKIVMSQAQCSKEEAISALEEEGNIAAAIIKLKST